MRPRPSLVGWVVPRAPGFLDMPLKLPRAGSPNNPRVHPTLRLLGEPARMKHGAILDAFRARGTTQPTQIPLDYAAFRAIAGCVGLSWRLWKGMGQGLRR